MNSGTILENKHLSIHFDLPQKEKVPPHLKKKKVIVIAGPTGVGKTELSLQMARVIGGEIISADSMQVYRGMDIGTAKASLKERLEVPHHLIDIRNLSEGFNVKDFYDAASHALKEILEKGHVPIIVGGTGFYLHALLYGPPTGPASVPAVRSRLEEEMKDKGSLILYDRLRSFDPTYASTITHKDRHKIIRALEIMTVTNQRVSEFAKEGGAPQESYNFRCWFIYMPKELLYEKVDRRCEKMVQEGFIEEVKELEKQGLKENSSASQAIGYRQCLEYLATGQTAHDKEHFVDAFKRASRRFAKRQFTWFRKEPLFRWLNIDHIPKERALETILQDYEQSF